ncbi:MAG: electron transport complex subunit E [Candidatus Omnitrophica bacterium]|nr:electron transport complex subunit E [Candidatus Omnitrophota bacterium]MBU1047985.1 electron transport complex subunit E [Candidatus Omnitrophota bacterium]MBU1631377.1 electron transport complex subunit E [Candidatus Omnitrophota bacterium]MBU1767160.1 electron transport complex subunit E [Candidatus Omnitrophota bacterium]MBU1889637.1 electron transport complex subunit E [Candidatus Omnitrophota bacterium]
MKAYREFIKGIWQSNPVFKILLGLCPTLAVTTQVQNGIAMGLAVLFVLVCSSFIISVFRKQIPPQVRIAVFIVFIATFVTLADYFLKAQFPQISKQLGPYVPLIVVNCIILGRAEAFASKNSIFYSLLDAIGMGLGFTLALVMLSSVRELLGSGSILGYQILGKWWTPWLIMSLPPGAFFTLGILMSIINTFANKHKKHRSVA